MSFAILCSCRDQWGVWRLGEFDDWHIQVLKETPCAEARGGQESIRQHAMIWPSVTLHICCRTQALSSAWVSILSASPPCMTWSSTPPRSLSPLPARIATLGQYVLCCATLGQYVVCCATLGQYVLCCATLGCYVVCCATLGLYMVCCAALGLYVICCATLGQYVVCCTTLGLLGQYVVCCTTLGLLGQMCYVAQH